MHYTFSHSNPQISPFYLPADARQRLQDEMAAARAERDKMRDYDDGNEQPLLAVVPPDGPDGAPPREDEPLAPRSADFGSPEAGAAPGADARAEAAAAGVVAACTAAEAAQAASVGTDLGPAGSAKPMGTYEGEEEPPHERARRLQWIMFYLRTDQPEEACVPNTSRRGPHAPLPPAPAHAPTPRCSCTCPSAAGACFCTEACRLSPLLPQPPVCPRCPLPFGATAFPADPIAGTDLVGTASPSKRSPSPP
eukprot:scaffold22953_cov96-Isochrysis_galbana.AAC.2